MARITGTGTSRSRYATANLLISGIAYGVLAFVLMRQAATANARSITNESAATPSTAPLARLSENTGDWAVDFRSAQQSPTAARGGSIRLTVEKVVELGDPAPGFGSGIVFEIFGTDNVFGGPFGALPRIDGEGTISFHAFVGDDADPTTMLPGSPRGMFRRVEGAIDVITRVGDPAPGTSAVFSGFPSPLASTPFLLNNGKVAFFGSADTIPGGEDGVWTDRSGELVLAMLENAQLPGMAPNEDIFEFTFATRGDTFFTNVRIAGGGAVGTELEGLWRNPGQWELIARDGTSAPGTEPGVVFGEGTGLAFFGPIDRWDADTNSKVAFNAYLDGPGVNTLNDEGIWNEGPDGLQIVVREGEVAPGTGGLRFGASTGLQAFNDEDSAPIVRRNAGGKMLFGARLNGPAFCCGKSIWTNRSGQLEQIAFALSDNPSNPPGDQAAGFPKGVTYTQFDAGAINVNDEIAFQGSVTDGNPVAVDPRAIWWDRPGEVTLLAHVGGPVPGVPGEVFTTVAFNGFRDSGHLWFSGTFTGPNNFGFFRVDPDGDINLVLRIGDLVDVGGGGVDIRTVGAFAVGAGSSNEGERVFEVFFTDGSTGIFTADLIQPPVLFGDLNCDGRIDALDIAPFVQAVLDPVGYDAAFPSCDINNGDLSSDGFVNESDVAPFVQCLTDNCP
ncbi:MAG: dockerin type I repeat-containing protein [Phycisphaerales bacterium]|nr:dockerin type I repeat-containing protein [Phycisphaerales bacterium]